MMNKNKMKKYNKKTHKKINKAVGQMFLPFSIIYLKKINKNKLIQNEIIFYKKIIYMRIIIENKDFFIKNFYYY